MTLKDFVASKGFPIFDLDNKIHRFDVFGGKNNGWFRGSVVLLSNGNNLQYCAFGDWRTSETFRFRTQDDTGEGDTILDKLEETMGLFNDKLHKEVATRDLKWFNSLPLWTNEQFEYLVTKGIKSTKGVRESVYRTSTTMVVPLYNIHGAYAGHQQITLDGEKIFCPGMKTKGAFHSVGMLPLVDGANVYICEGYSTGVSVFEHFTEGTKLPVLVLCAMNANNLANVAQDVRLALPMSSIIIMADNDRLNLVNVGVMKALAAAKKVGATVLIPWPVKGTDYNDLITSGGAHQMESHLIERGGDTTHVIVEHLDRPADVAAPTIVPNVEPLHINANSFVSASGTPIELDHEGRLKVAPVEVQQPIAEPPRPEPAQAISALGAPIDFSDIPTAQTGFHTLSHTKAGIPKWTPSYTDLAIYFSRMHRFKVPLGTENIYGFNGKCYKLLPDSFVNVFAQRHFFPRPNNNVTREFLGFIHRTNDVPNDWFELQKNKINLNNGVLNFVTGELSPHSGEVGFKYVLPFDYDPSATCPVFEKVLHKVTCGDETLQKIILEFFGYGLSGDNCWAQKTLVFDGEGENGKSTIMEVLESLCGKENKSSLTLNEMKNPNDRAALDGKLFNIAEETPNRGLAESSIFKNLVTGGTVRAKLMYKDTYEFKNMAKLILACNELPPSYDASNGFFRRFIIIPFKAKFNKTDPDFDPFIRDKLRQELSGIFNLCLVGYKRLIASRSFTESKAVQEAIESYKDEIDFTRNWFNDCVIVEGLDSARRSDKKNLYTSYVHWCESNGFKALNSVHFGRRLATIIPNYDSRNKRGITHSGQRKPTPLLIGIYLIDATDH